MRLFRGLRSQRRRIPPPVRWKKKKTSNTIIRFLNDKSASAWSATYLPFGIGPRNCVGARFAEMEFKTVLAAVIRKFVVELDPDNVCLSFFSYFHRLKQSVRRKAENRQFLLRAKQSIVGWTILTFIKCKFNLSNDRYVAMNLKNFLLSNKDTEIRSFKDEKV